MIREAKVAVFVLQLLLPSQRLATAQETRREDDVRAAVSAFSRAFVEADVPHLRGRLTREYVHINGRSGNVLNRGEWLSWVIARRAALDSKELVVDHYSADEIVVKLYGETAVVTGIVESSGTRKGVPFRSRVRFTNLWVRQGGEWLRAAFHDSPLPGD